MTSLIVFLTSIVLGVLLLSPSQSRSSVDVPTSMRLRDVDSFATLLASMDEAHEIWALEYQLFGLSDDALFERGITEADNEDGKDWAVAWCRSTDKNKLAICEALDQVGISHFTSIGHGSAGWYVERQHFFAARTTLLNSPAIRALGIKVVTPRVELLPSK
jgi:hypothetical protein